MRSQFTFYRSFFDAISKIKKGTDRVKAYDMICAYALNQTEPDLTDAPEAVAIVFDLLRPVFDKAKAKSENGQKGGSKSKSDDKQIASKPEANEEQTAKEKEGEKEKEREREVEVEKEKGKENFPAGSKPDAQRPAPPPSPAVPYDEIQALYNRLCPSLPKCTAMSEARKKALKARIRSGYTLDDFRRLFENAEGSEFLKGQNNRNWAATFDWLVADANMAKVLDGNYDNRALSQYQQARNPGKYTKADELNEFYEMGQRWANGGGNGE